MITSVGAQEKPPHATQRALRSPPPQILPIVSMILSEIVSSFHPGRCMCVNTFLRIWWTSEKDVNCLITAKGSQSQVRAALSVIGWYQKGPCVNYDYVIKNFKRLPFAFRNRAINGHLPDHWSSMSSEKIYIRVKLEPSSKEFKIVERLFRHTMKDEGVIVEIKRLQNPFLWEKYCRLAIFVA